MEPDRGVSSKVWIATAISSCVVVVHFHHTQRVKAPSADLVIPLLGQNGHVPFEPNTHFLGIKFENLRVRDKRREFTFPTRTTFAA